jgi:hypothetical protein
VKRLTLIALALTALIAVSACGGDDDEVSPTPTPRRDVNTSLPRHLASVSPVQESTVTNQDIQAGGGICASFDFRVGETMGDDPTSRVKLLLDEEDVTESTSFVVTDDFPTSQGTICYDPTTPLEAGERTATVRYSDATDRQFIYNWTFTVADPAATESP